jgi:hypothetical protein
MVGDKRCPCHVRPKRSEWSRGKWIHGRLFEGAPVGLLSRPAIKWTPVSGERWACDRTGFCVD